VVEEGTVRRLLEVIEQRLVRLTQASDVSFDQYQRDLDLQDIVERNLEICIQACIDLGLHVLADFPSPLPNTNRGVFKALLREDLIAADLAARLERMAGFRNVLAHGYADVILERVHAALGELDDIRAYLRALERYLSSLPPQTR
jgi:uncharacterized protein YutE (UPF0331/DUF86 family)